MAKPGGAGSAGRAADPRGMATRAALVEAATAALQEVGFAGASAREIARRAGCRQSQVFYHFGSVAGVLLAALDAASQRRRAAFDGLVSDARDIGDLLDAAADIIRADLDSGDVTVLVEMLAGARLVPGLDAEVMARLQPWQEFAERAVATALPEGPIARLAPVPDLAHAVVAGILGLELLAHVSGDRETPGRILDEATGAVALLTLLVTARRTESP